MPDFSGLKELLGFKSEPKPKSIFGGGRSGGAGANRSWMPDPKSPPSSNDLSMPTAITTAGVGLGGAELSRNLGYLQRAYSPTNPAEYYKALERFASIKNLPPEVFPYLYSRFGYDLTSQPVRSGNTVISAGDALLRAKRMINADIHRNPFSPRARLLNGLLGLFGATAEVKHMGPDASRWEKIKTLFSGPIKGLKMDAPYYQDWVGPKAHQAWGADHYKAFSKSPLDAYKQIFHEIQLTNNPISEVKELLAHALTRDPINRQKFMASTWGLKPGVNFDDIFSQVTANAPRKPVYGLAEARQIVNRALEEIPNSFAGPDGKTIINTPMKHINDWVGRHGISTLEELRLKPTILQKLYDPVITQRFGPATKTYATAARTAKLLSMLGSRPARVAALGAVGYGGYNIYKNLSKKADVGTDPVTVGSGLTGLAGIIEAARKMRDIGSVRRLNPLGKINVQLLGGTVPLGADMKGVPLDSFSAQTHALHKSLSGTDRRFINRINADLNPLYLRSYKPIPDDAFLKTLNKADAVVQVGSTPYDPLLGRLPTERGVPRYRALTDFNHGNFVQPEQWLEQANWMRVNDPKSYTRFLVPGSEGGLPPEFHSAKPPIYTPNIDVSPVFKDKPFTNIPAPRGRARAYVGTGGGAGTFMMYDDVLNKGKELTVLDDIVAAMRKKHGDNFTVYVPNPYSNAKPGRTITRAETLVRGMIEAKRSGNPRFKNIVFVKNMPQKGLANVYSKMDYIFGLPGSTTAEMLHMKGQPGKVVNLLPDKSYWWMPKHYDINSRYMEQALPGTRSVSLASTNRLQSLIDAVMEGRESMGVNRPLYANHKPFIRALINDVRLSRLKNLGRVGGPLAIALAALGYTGNRVKSQMEKASQSMAIPDMNDYGEPLKRLKMDELVKYVLQKHTTRRNPRNPHYDLRIGTPETGLYSWAVPGAKLPKPGDKGLAPQTQVHAYRYGDFEGNLPGIGYGAGTVEMADKGEAQITRVTPHSVHFTLAHSRIPTRFVLVKIDTKAGRDWMLLNQTPTKSPAGVGSKPKMKLIQADDIDDALEQAKTVQEKIDGAHGIYNFDDQGRLDVFSVNKRVTGEPIPHRERMGLNDVRIPKQMGNTTLRGEMYAVNTKGKALPFNEISGLLNQNIADSIRKQRKEGITPQSALFDVVRYKGKSTSKMTPEERRQILTEIAAKLPADKVHLPEEAVTPEEKAELFEETISGKNPRTSEGVILRMGDNTVYKFKQRPDSTVYLAGTYPGEGKRKNVAGGLTFSMEPKGPATGRVGTGFTDAELADVVKNIRKYVGRPMRVEHQGEYKRTGKLRAPSFKGFELDKTAQDSAYHAVYDDPKGTILRAILASGVLKPGDPNSAKYKRRAPKYRPDNGVVYLSPHNLKDPSVTARFKIPIDKLPGEVAWEYKRKPLTEEDRKARMAEIDPIAQQLYDSIKTRRHRKLLQILHKGEIPVDESMLDKTAAPIPKHVFITGAPGAGKTTLAKQLAKERGLPILAGDSLPPTGSHRFPGTNSLSSALAKLKEPHVVEGVQITGLPASAVAGHEVITLDRSRRELVKRLLARGWQDAKGVMRGGANKGFGDTLRAHYMVHFFIKYLRQFKSQLAKTGIPTKSAAINQQVLIDALQRGTHRLMSHNGGVAASVKRMKDMERVRTLAEQLHRRAIAESQPIQGHFLNIMKETAPQRVVPQLKGASVEIDKEAGVVRLETKQAYIQRSGKRWVLKSKDGKKILGRHKTRRSALRQERAIQMAKHASLCNNCVTGALKAKMRYGGDVIPLSGRGSKLWPKDLRDQVFNKTSADTLKGIDISDLMSHYDTFDSGHNRNHASSVAATAASLADKYYPKDKELVLLAAKLHDIGLIGSREEHETVGADMVDKDPRFNVLTPRVKHVLVNAIRHHRSSTGRPTSIVGRIISDADRGAGMDAAGQIQRGYDYGLKHYPKLTQDEHVARVLEHLVMKYGPGGKGRRHYFPETETRLNDMIDPVIQLHKNKDIEGAKKLIKLSAPNLPFSYQRAQGIAQLIKGRLSYPDSLNKWVGNTDTSKLQNIVAALMTTGRGIKNLGNQASVHHGPPQTNPFLGILSSKLRISKMIDDVLVAERNQQPAFFSGGMGRSTLRSSGEPLRSVVYTPPQITHPKVTPGTPLVEVHIPQTEIPEFMSLGKRPMNVLPGLDQGSPMWHRVLNHEEWRPVGEQIAKAVPQMGEIVRGYPNPKEVSELQRLVMNFVRTHRNVGT